MMYHSKKAVILILVASMILMISGGCQTKRVNDKKEQTKPSDTTTMSMGNGRFFENEVTVPKGIQEYKTIRRLSDGSLAAIGCNNKKEYFLLNSKDMGKTWKQTGISDLKREYIPHAAIAPDGTAAFFPYAKENKITMSIANTDGKTESISLTFVGQKRAADSFQVQQAAYNEQGDLFIRTTGNTIYTVAADGSCHEALETDGISIHYFHIIGNILAGIHEEGILLYDTQTGKQLPSEESLDDLIRQNKEFTSNNTDIGFPMIFAKGTEESGMMFANKEGIFHYTMGGSVIEQLLDGGMTSLGSGNTTFYAMAVPDQNNIFILANSGSEETKLYHYVYDEDAASVPDQELTVYTLDESVYLRQAVALFQKKHPEIHINLEIGLSGKDGVTLEDALSVLNTNILAGKGPDVLILDGMPVESYIEKGILEDLSDTITEIDQKDGIFPNIIQASKQDDHIYAMPARLLLPALQGKDPLRKASGSLETLAKEMSGSPAKDLTATDSSLFKGPETLLRDLYDADSARWQKSDGKLDQNALTKYLQYAKQIYDSYSQDRKREDRMDGHIRDAALENGEKAGTLLYNGLLTGEWDCSFGTISSIYDLQTVCSIRAVTGMDYDLLNREQTKSYIPYLSVGVIKGGNTDAGKKFVKLLLGKKAENSESNGIPVNRAAFDALCHEKLDAKNVRDESSILFAFADSEKEYGFSYINLTQKDIDHFSDIIESLSDPAMTNRMIQKIILEQGKKYLLEEQDLQTSVDAIMQKSNLYLTE